MLELMPACSTLARHLEHGCAGSGRLAECYLDVLLVFLPHTYIVHAVGWKEATIHTCMYVRLVLAPAGGKLHALAHTCIGTPTPGSFLLGIDAPEDQLCS